MGGIRGLLEVDAGVTPVHGDATGTWGFAIGLSLSPSLSAGGAGRLLTSPVDVGEVDFREVVLELGYGGIFARFGGRGPFTGTSWHAGVLLGAGNADVMESTTRLRLGSDNFFFAEPSFGLDRGLTGPLRATIAASYRLVFGVEDLTGVEASDLRGPALTVGLRLSPR